MNLENTKNIHSVLIIEVLGSPKEFVNETLKDLIEKIKQEKGVHIVESKINEPKEIKEKKNFYTNFAEVEIKTDTILNLAILMFKYMPAHIEVIEPENVNLTNNAVNDILNELVRRLHGYDNLARVFQFEKKQMLEEIQKLKEKKPKKKN
jgi:hypothetical protein